MKDAVTVPVYLKEGLQGWVNPHDLTRREDQALVRVFLDNGQEFWVTPDLLHPQTDGSFSLPLRPSELQNWTTGQEDLTRAKDLFMPVVEEELVVEKHPVITGKVQVTQRVNTEEQVIDEPGFHETVQVEHIPRDEFLDVPASTRYEGEVLIIPVMEEVLVVEKRLRLK